MLSPHSSLPLAHVFCLVTLVVAIELSAPNQSSSGPIASMPSLQTIKAKHTAILTVDREQNSVFERLDHTGLLKFSFCGPKGTLFK